ncbi:MAG: zinc-ribbon domain-containing protein [Candidatus Asgardarchaeia archaeon]
MSTKKCPYCNAIIPADAVFCPNCGAQLTAPQPQPTYQPPPQPTYAPQPPAPAMPPVYPQQPIKEKSSAIAAILSFLIPGVGQIYVGKAKRGILILILGIVIAKLI